MASKRKQDEKHLAILRGLVKLEHNKQCFDCSQRGPTYVNMTIGSFVCTACSGQLRGLNPPHRVKSISMASFTQEEVEFIRKRGNDFCRKVWLGGPNAQNKFDSDIKDENKIRDFMTLKYEKKRFYIAPTEAMLEEARRMNEPPKAEPVTKPLRSLGNIPNLQVQQQQAAQAKAGTSNQAGISPAHSASHPFSAAPAAPVQEAPPRPSGSSGVDLLGEIGGDPFTAGPRPAQPAAAGGFADFSAFSGSPPQSSQALVPQQQSAGSLPTPAPVPPSASSSDKYSALADLDSVFGGSGGSGAVSWDSSGWGGVSSSQSKGVATTSAFGSGGGPGFLSGPGSANPFGAASSTSSGSFLTNGSAGQSAPPVGGWALPGMAPSAGPPKPSSSTSFPQTNSNFPQSASSGFPTTFSSSNQQQPFGSAGFSQAFGANSTAPGFGAPTGQQFSSQPPAGQQFPSQAPQGMFGTPQSQGFGGFAAQQPPAFGTAPPQQQGFGVQQGFGAPAPQQGGFGAPPPQQSAFGAPPQQQQQGFGAAFGQPTPAQHISGQFMGQWGAQPAANPFMNVANQAPPASRPLNSTNPFL